MIWCTLLVMDYIFLSDNADAFIQKMCTLISHYKYLWAANSSDDILKYKAHGHVCGVVFEQQNL